MRGRPADLFPTDEPLPADGIIGRGSDRVEMIARLGDAGQNVVLVDPRRTGKTTICRAVVEELERRGFYTVSIDLFNLSLVSQLADAFVEGAIANRPALRRVLRRARETGRSLLEALTVSVAAKGAGVDLQGLDLSLAAELRADPDAYLDYALRLPERIAAADDRPLVLFIDEFQDLIRIGDGDYAGGSEGLTRKLRAVFQDARAVSFLFAGSIEHMMRDLVSDPDAAFFEFGTIMALSPITADEWREGLAERYARDRTRVDDGALTRLIELGDGHPRATMLLAQQAHLAAILAGSRHVTLPLVEAALLEAMRSERKRHETLVEHVQTLGSRAVRRYTLPVAHALASGRAARRGVRRDHETSRVIKELRDAGIVAGYDRDSLRIVDPLFARYLRALPLPQPL